LQDVQESDRNEFHRLPLAGPSGEIEGAFAQSQLANQRSSFRLRISINDELQSHIQANRRSLSYTISPISSEAATFGIALLPAAEVVLPNAGFAQILSSGKSAMPPCKSGQLKKDLGLEASSLRDAARLIIFEVMTSFFVWFKKTRRLTSRLTLVRRTHETFRTLTVSVNALLHFDFESF